MKVSMMMTVALLAASACGGAPEPELNAVPTALEGSGKSDDISASNCEVFVDAAQIFTGDEGLFGPRMFIKTINSRLDGNITGVGFYGQITFRGYSDQASEPGNYTAYKAQSYYGASDYFSVDLGTSTDTGASYYVGAFYVTTDKGTTYWANAKSYAGTWDANEAVPQHPAQNFYIDGAFADALDAMSVHGSDNKMSILGFASSDNQGPYFNPQSCK